MTILEDIFSVFGLTVSWRKTETMCVPTPHTTPAASTLIFNTHTSGLHCCQITSSIYMEGAATKSPIFSFEVDRRTSAGLVKSDVVVEGLLCGCASWALLKIHYNKLRTAHHRMLLRIVEDWCRPRDDRILSYHKTFSYGQDAILYTVDDHAHQ